VVLLKLEVKELFLAFLSWEKHDRTLIRTHWEGLKCEHMKKSVVLPNRYHNYSRLSWPLSKPCHNTFDTIIIEDYLKLEEGVHIFSLDLIFLHLKVCSFTFICLKMSTWLAQNYPKKKMNNGQTSCCLPSILNDSFWIWIRQYVI